MVEDGRIIPLEDVHNPLSPETAEPAFYDHPDFRYYPQTGLVEIEGEPFSHMTRKEREVIGLFYPNPNRLVTKKSIMQVSSKNENEGYAGAMINHIRQKISPDSEKAFRILETVAGIGYVLNDGTKPVELVAQESAYVDYHLRVPIEDADSFERVMARFSDQISLRRLEPETELRIMAAKTGAKRKTKLWENPVKVESESLIVCKDFTFNPNSLEVDMGERKEILTPREAQLLYILAKNPGIVVTRSMMIDYMDVNKKIGFGNVSTHMVRLRKKLGYKAMGGAIETIPGIGFRFNP